MIVLKLLGVNKYNLVIIFLSISLFCFGQKKIEGKYKLKTKISFSTGIVNNNFSWNISGNLSGKNPTVLSELIWQGLTGFQYAFEAELWYRKLGISVNYDRNNFYKGNVTDTDYNSDNRQDIVFFADLNALL